MGLGEATDAITEYIGFCVDCVAYSLYHQRVEGLHQLEKNGFQDS